MEFLVPGFLLLLFAVIFIFTVIPRFGPFFTLIGAALLLTAGMFHHYKLFRVEYANATWADRLKAYGPGILYSAMALFIVGFIFSLWGGGSVPVPEAPSPSLSPPTPESSESSSPLSAVTNTVSAVTNTAANAFKDTMNMGRELVRNIGQGVGNIGQRAAAALPFGQPAAPVAAPSMQLPPAFSRPPNNRNKKNVSFFSEY